MTVTTTYPPLLVNIVCESAFELSYPCLLGREKKIETTRTPCVEQKFSQIEFVYRNRDGQEDPKGEGKKVM